MTNKDYIALGKILKNARNSIDPSITAEKLLEIITDEIVNLLETDNSRFNEQDFRNFIK